MIKGIFFDVGGTLCLVSAEAKNECQSFKSVLFSLTECEDDDLFEKIQVLLRTSASPKYRLVQRICKHLGIGDWKSIYARLQAHRFRVILFQDVLPCLQNLQSYRLGILSNTSVWTAFDHENLGLGQYMECSILSCYVGTAKPSREIFDRACDAFGYEARELVYVGDSLTYDILPALSAGWNAVLVDRRLQVSQAPARIIPDLSFLPAVIAAL